MKTRAWVACVACIALGFVLGSLSQPQLAGQENAKEPERTKWEYLVIHGAGDSETLTGIGEKGWELTAVISLAPDRSTAYFKRRK